MWEFFSAVGKAIWGVWTLDSSMGPWFGAHPQNTEIAIAVAMLAGASILVGNSVVLFLNRIRGWRFFASLVLNGLSFAFLYAVQALAIAGVGYLVTGDRVGPQVAIRAVLLATAPLVLGFFELIPYLGPGIARILQAWGMVALWVVVGVLYGVDRWTALAITLTGWGVMQALSWALSTPVTKLGNAIWKRLSGQPTLVTARDILSGHQFMPVEFDFTLPDVEGRPT